MFFQFMPFIFIVFQLIPLASLLPSPLPPPPPPKNERIPKSGWGKVPSAKKRRTNKTSAPKTEVQGGHFGITKGLRAVPSFVEIGCFRKIGFFFVGIYK